MKAQDVEESPVKKLVTTVQVDPEEAVAQAALSTLLKKKVKTDSGSKGSLV